MDWQAYFDEMAANPMQTITLEGDDLRTDFWEKLYQAFKARYDAEKVDPAA